MDPNLTIPWKDRVLTARLALKQNRSAFARMAGCAIDILESIERGKKEPNLKVMRFVRLLESKYPDEIAEGCRLARKYNARYFWGKETKIYERFGGYRYKKVAVGYRSRKLEL